MLELNTIALIPEDTLIKIIVKKRSSGWNIYQKLNREITESTCKKRTCSKSW